MAPTAPTEAGSGRAPDGCALLKKALLKVGYGCNNDCVFCHSRPWRTLRPPSTETLEARIRSVARAGAEMAVFSGGEPTVRRDLERLADAARTQGLRVGVITNGRRFSDARFCRRLRRQGLEFAYVSFHSARRRAHRASAGTDSLAQTLDGIRHLIDSGTSVTVNTVVTRHNIDALPEAVDLLAPLGARKLKFSVVEPKGAALGDPSLCPELSRAAAAIAGALREGRARHPRQAFGCEGLTPCLLEDFETLNDDLFTNRFILCQEAFEDRPCPPDYRNRSKPDSCRGCAEAAGCPGVFSGYLERKPAPKLAPRKLAPVDPELELSRAIAARVRWIGGDLPYPPEAAWKPLPWEQVRRAWKETASLLEPDHPAGLYVDLPRPAAEQGADAYLHGLEREARALEVPRSLRFRTLYVGGCGQGVFSRLTAAQARRLFELLRAGFELGDCEQASVELDLFRTAAEHAALLRSFGVGRVTALVPPAPRPADQALLKTVARRFVERTREIPSIDIDVACTPSGLASGAARDMLEFVLDLEPQTVHLQRRPDPGLAAAPPGAAVREAWEGCARLAAERLGGGSGAREDNLQLYHAKRLQGSILGLGFEAVSHARGLLRYRKAGGYADYLRACAQGEPAVLGCAMTPEDERRSFVVRNLENAGEVRLEAFRRIFGAGMEESFASELEAARRLGAVVRDGDRLLVPPSFTDGRETAAKFFYSAAHRAEFGRPTA